MQEQTRMFAVGAKVARRGLRMAPDRILERAPLGAGVASNDQVAPFHCSIAVGVGPCCRPTAMQFDTLVHATDNSTVPFDPPTAKRFETLEQATLLNTALVGAPTFGLFTICHASAALTGVAWR